jgi:hypothetical protein
MKMAGEVLLHAEKPAGRFLCATPPGFFVAHRLGRLIEVAFLAVLVKGHSNSDP